MSLCVCVCVCVCVCIVKSVDETNKRRSQNLVKFSYGRNHLARMIKKKNTHYNFNCDLFVNY